MKIKIFESGAVYESGLGYAHYGGGNPFESKLARWDDGSYYYLIDGERLTSIDIDTDGIDRQYSRLEMVIEKKLRRVESDIREMKARRIKAGRGDNGDK